MAVVEMVQEMQVLVELQVLLTQVVVAVVLK